MVAAEPAEITALEPKTKLTGRVIKITLAGALVDIGQPLPGVLHISQLSATPINKVEDVVAEGQSIEVWIRRVKKDRIELTMVEPLMYEWRELQPEMIVKGKVVRLETYGVFVDFGAEKPGLIHVSELARGYVKSPSEVVKEGDEVEVKILDVDRRKHQIRLSRKALQPEIIEEKPPQPEAKAPHQRKNRKQPRETEETPETPSAEQEPQITAMQAAWQEAVERSKGREKAQRPKNQKSISPEHEDILDRTLKKRITTDS
jgi:predicted RNA-binding protein with RPS1 domain